MIRDRYSPFNLAAFNATLDHGALLGLADDDHPQYIKDSEFTQDSGFLVGTGAGTFQEETGAILRTSIGVGTGDSPQFTGLTLSGLTQGSVPFAGASGVISQDNANLFWDDTNNRLGIGTTAPDKSLEIRDASPILRLRDTGATANATTAFIEFGGTDGGNWARTGWVGDGSSANTDIFLQAEVSDLHLGDSSSSSVLTLSGGDATFTGSINIGDSGRIYFRDTDISIGSTLTDGILDISADFSIDMFYDNADVGAEVDGQSLNINRRAAEGDDYISLRVNKDKKGSIGFSGDDDLLQLEANVFTVNGTITDGTASLVGGALTGLTNLTVDNININGSAITSSLGNLTLDSSDTNVVRTANDFSVGADLDVAGDVTSTLSPGTDNNLSLGTDALRWRNVKYLR